MKVLGVFLGIAAAVAMARPGGYTLMGGVYKPHPDKELDYMDQARNAGKFAWDLKLESEVSSPDVDRGARDVASASDSYTPTFFTAPQNHEALHAAAAASAQPVRVVQRQQNAPLYYQQRF